MSQNKKIALGIGAVIAVLLVVGLIGGALNSDTNEDTTASDIAASSTSTATEVQTSEVGTTGPQTTPAVPPPARETTAKPAGCEAVPSQYLAIINASWRRDGWSFINTSAYAVGGTTYVAGEIANAEGGIRSRDDLFAARNGVVTPVSMTARNESDLPDLHRVLDVNFTDEGAQTALDCARTY